MADEVQREQAQQGQGHHGFPRASKDSLLENDVRWRELVATCQRNGMDNENPDASDVIAFFLTRFTVIELTKWRKRGS